MSISKHSLLTTHSFTRYLIYTLANSVTVVQIFTLTTILVTLALAPGLAMLVADQAPGLGPGLVTTPPTPPPCMTSTSHTTDTPPRPFPSSRAWATSHDLTRAVSPAWCCVAVLSMSVFSAHCKYPCVPLCSLSSRVSPDSSRIPFHIRHLALTSLTAPRTSSNISIKTQSEKSTRRGWRANNVEIQETGHL